MANDTRSTRKSKDDESTSSRKKAIVRTTDTCGLRRSTRETPSRKQTSTSPSTTRKSQRLESMTPATTPAKRKPGIIGKQKVSCPLRRSNRFKKSTSSSSGAKKSNKGSGSSDVKSKKLKREKSMKKLALEGRELNRRDKQDPKPVGLKTKRMDARTFSTFFKQQQRRDTSPDIVEELERPDKLLQDDSSCCGNSVSKQVGDEEDGGEECSERMGEKLTDKRTEATSGGDTERSVSGARNFNTEAVGNHAELEFLCASQKRTSSKELPNASDGDGLNFCKSGQNAKETVDDAESMHVDCSTVEKLQTPEVVGSGGVVRILDVEIDKGIGDRVASKRKRCAVWMDFTASKTLGSKHVCTSNVDACSPSCEADDFVETCPTCSKRRRVDNDSPMQDLCLCDVALNKGVQYSPVLKDRGDLEANVQGSVEETDGTARDESPLTAQIDGHQIMCFVCKLGGKLLWCCDGKGCKKRYHLSCLDLPLDDVPTRVWHCPTCVRKKIDCGVYSLSEGVESVWDAREVEVQDTEYGLRKQKQYFVKYNGLAHVHNQWIPESQLIREAPLLVLKFNQNNKVVKWREQWKTPHRLLKKRLLRSPKQQHDNAIEHAGDISDCHYEWLVKWCGLDYEYATWELENASFLQSPLAQSLISKYENRHQRAKRAASFSLLDKNKKGSLVKLSKLPAGVFYDSNKLNSINKLREHWHKGQNAVFFNDQERVTKVILFIESVVANISQPFLIISDSSALSLWEAEFLRLGSSTDVISYNGNEDSRRIIRTFEFYEEGGCIMFQALLCPLEALVEDFEMLECLRWEAVIVDECQRSGICKHFGQIKMLSTEVRFLLFNGQLKDSIDEHLNLLSLLESCSDLDSMDGPETDLSDNLGRLKERLSRYIAYDCKPNMSRFLEYWVPVLISNVQLEQYCATLLSNYTSLRSYSKKDPVGALHNILLSTRKSCDHPYIVDPLLQRFLTKDSPPVEYLDVGIKASGKLQLLDTLLSEFQNRGLRVVILFQSIAGSEKDLMGDILEDFIIQRYGPDSYERVVEDFGPKKLHARKQAALNKFNNKDSRTFVFLLEIRACLPRIKLSSVDSIIVFDSDWNPANDIRALQKLTFDSSFEPIKIFRLYSSCTAEEKVLLLASRDVIDRNSRLSPSTIHMLLMWGASYLFSKLEEFHGVSISTTGANIYSETSLLKDVAKEFLTLVRQDDENTFTNTSLITKVQHSMGRYSKNGSLLGELKIKLSDGEEPVVFWTKLLEGRNPQWRFSSGLPQRNRKRVQCFADLPKRPEVEAIEAGKKRKKLVNDKADPASIRARLKEGDSGVPVGGGPLPISTASVTGPLHKTHGLTPPFPSTDDTVLPDLHMVDSEEVIGMRDMQRSLHAVLEPEILALSEILKLSEDVKVMVRKFLEYIIHNHHVNREPASILQAFQISLCWVTASMLKYQIDRKESLTLAKKRLNFGCTEEEANNVYLKLRSLRKMFLSHVENFKESERTQDSVLAGEDIVKEPPYARMTPSISALCLKNVKVETEERSENHKFVEDLLLSQRQVATRHKLEEKEISIDMKRIQKKCEKRMTKLIRKQQEEIQEWYRILEDDRADLEKQYRVDAAVLRSIHGNNPVGVDKLKKLDDEFAKKKEECKIKNEMRLKDIKAKHLGERNKMKQTEALLMEKVKSWEQAEPSRDLPPNGSEFGGTSEHRVHNGPEDRGSGSGCLVEEQCPNRMLASGNTLPVNSKTAANEAVGVVGVGVTVETPTISLYPNHEIGAEGSISSHRSSVAGFEKLSNIYSSANAPEDNIFVNPSSAEEQILDEAPSSAQNMPVSAPNEVLGAPDSVEIVNPNMEYVRQDLPISAPDAITNLIDTAGCIINSDSPSVEPSLVDLVQPAVTPARAGMFSQNMAQSTSPGISDIDAPARVNQNVLQEEVPPLPLTDGGRTDQTNHEALTTQHAEKLQLSPSADSPVDQNQHNSRSASGVQQPPQSDGHIASLNGEAPQQLENPLVSSNVAVLHPGANLAPPSPIHVTDLPCGQNQHLVVRNDQPSRDMEGLPDQVVGGSQLGMDPPIDTLGGVGTCLPSHSAHQVNSRPEDADPLQTELERLRKETEQTDKVYEDMKLRLKSDWEKEIKEIIAEIHRKYEAKLHDAEAAFLLRKKELDTNLNKVLMNKKLADAFRSKCLDSGSLETQRAVPPNLTRQVHLLSSMSSLRPSFVTGSPSVVPASASQQTTAPPLQVVHHSSALFSSMTNRPHIVPITPATRNLQTVSEIRAPAPHLQPFRPLSSTAAASTTSLPRALPTSLQAPRNLPITSHSVPLLAPPRPPPPPPLSPPPTYHSGLHDRVPQPDVMGAGLLRLQNSSLSAMGLLLHVNNQPGAHPPNILPPLPDLSSSFGSLDISQFGAPDGEGGGSGRANLVTSGVATDIVCLLDDDE